MRILIASLLLLSALNVGAVEPPGIYNPVPDYRVDIPSTRAAFLTFREAVQQDTTLTPEQKAEKVRRKVLSIETEFRGQRTAAYGKFYERLRIEHSCTQGCKKGSCSKKKCDPRTEEPPKCQSPVTAGTRTAQARVKTFWGIDTSWDDMRRYTGGDWTNRGIVRDSGKEICPPYLKKSSFGSIRTITFANFTFTPQHIEAEVRAETGAFISAVTQ